MDYKSYQVPLEFERMSERQHLSTGVPRVSAMLRFDSRQPYTIELTFYILSAVAKIDPEEGPTIHNWDEIKWTFSREILEGALHRKSGSMDVLAWPETIAGHAYVYLRLSDRHSAAVVRVGWWIIMQFMQEVNMMVPLHDASRYLDNSLDQDIAQLLSDGTKE